MSNGYLYILTNPSFSPDLLKIGTTTRTPEERANELYEEHAGIPTKFVVAYKKQTTNCQLTKEIVHRRLNDHRPDQYKDFFQLPLQEATIVIDQVVKEIDELYHSGKVKSKQLEIVPSQPPDLSTPVDMDWFNKKGEDDKEEVKTTKFPYKDTELIQETLNRYFHQASGSNSFASIAKKKAVTKDKAGADELRRKAEARAKRSELEYKKKKSEKKAIKNAKEKTIAEAGQKAEVSEKHNTEKLSAYDSGDAKAKDWYEKGYILTQSGQYSDAINAYNKAIDQDNNFAEAFFGRGICFYKRCNYYQANKDIGMAAVLGNKDAKEFLINNPDVTVQDDENTLSQIPSISADIVQTTSDTLQLASTGQRLTKYILAILACTSLVVLYTILGVALFGWKHGGGAIPMVILFSAVWAVWRAITKKRGP